MPALLHYTYLSANLHVPLLRESVKEPQKGHISPLYSLNLLICIGMSQTWRLIFSWKRSLRVSVLPLNKKATVTTGLKYPDIFHRCQDINWIGSYCGKKTQYWKNGFWRNYSWVGVRVLDEVRGRYFGVHFSLYILRASRQMADIKRRSHVTSLNRTAEIEVIKIHLIKLL